MNRAAVLILTLILTLGLGANGYAVDTDTIRQMKDLKAIMDEMPESTAVKTKVKEEIKKPVIEKVREEVEIKAEIADVSVDTVELDDETSDVNVDQEEMADDPRNQGFLFTNENNIIPLDSEELQDEIMDQSLEDELMNKYEDETVNTEADQLKDAIEASVSEQEVEFIEGIEEEDLTVLDMLKDTEMSSAELIQDESDVASKEVKASDFEMDISENTDSVEDMEMVEYREDLADEISEEINVINLEIEEIEGAIDQEISELRQDLDQLSETNLDEEISSDY